MTGSVKASRWYFSCGLSLLFWFFITGVVFADKGQIWPYPAILAQESQKAIILHNGSEEVLILGTELRADQRIGVLEFIPFPAEPLVVLAKGDPFEAMNGLISQKGLQYIEISKGETGVSPVELKFSQKMGVHDVTVIAIHDRTGFSRWVKGFFKKKRIPLRNNLDVVCRNAGDYLERGFRYFVFDYVTLNKEVKFVEPLLYRFESEMLYYPLKTSNIIGGEGLVDLVLALPGTLGLLNDGGDIRKLNELFNGIGQWDLSSSAKVYPDELAVVYPEAADFFKTGKIYLQVLQFSGRYQFAGDVMLDISNIAPYASKHIIYMPDYSNDFQGGSYVLAGSLSADEKKDMVEAYNRKKPEWFFDPELVKAIQDLLNSGEDSK